MKSPLNKLQPVEEKKKKKKLLTWHIFKTDVTLFEFNILRLSS